MHLNFGLCVIWEIVKKRFMRYFHFLYAGTSANEHVTIEIANVKIIAHAKVSYWFLLLSFMRFVGEFLFFIEFL